MKKSLKAGVKKSQQPQSRLKKAPQTQPMDAAAVAAAGTEEDEAAAFASGELSPPINATEDLYRADKIAEAATITLRPPSSAGSDASVPDFLRRSERDAGTFAVIKVERDKGTIHFRLRADIDPGWMIQQHQARQAAIEAEAELQRKLAQVAEFKRKSRPNQLSTRRPLPPQQKIVATAAEKVGEQQVQQPLKQPKSEVKLIRAAPKSARGRPSVKILKKAVAAKAAQKVGKAREKAAPKLQLRSVGGAGRKTLVDESLKKRALNYKKVVLETRQSKPSGFKSAAAKKVSIKNTKSASVKSDSPRVSRKTPAKNLLRRVDSAKSHSSQSSKPKSQQQKQQEKSKLPKAAAQKVKEIGGKLKSKLPKPTKSKPKLQKRPVVKEPGIIQANDKNAEEEKNEAGQNTAILEDKETAPSLMHEEEGSAGISIEEDPNTQIITVAEQSTMDAIVEENHLSGEIGTERDMVKFQDVEENSGLQTGNLEEVSKLPGEKDENGSAARDEERQSKSSLTSVVILEERRRSSLNFDGFRQRSDSRVKYSNDEFRYFDDSSPIDDDGNFPDELTSALTDDEIELIKDKMEEKKRKLKKVKLAEYNNAYQESRSDWENFEIDEDDIDFNDELMEIFEMRRKKSSMGAMPQYENQGQEQEEAPREPIKSSMTKKSKHPIELENIAEEEEEDLSKLKMCQHCGWMVCLFENCKPVESQEGEDPTKEIEHSDCPKCGLDVVKERPSPAECINCLGVFGSNTLFELEFDMQARRSKVICSICREPLKIAQKQRQPQRVIPQGVRLDIKRDPVFQEMFSKWDAKDGEHQKGDAPPFDLSGVYSSIYHKDFSKVHDLAYFRVKPPRAAIPQRPPFDKPTTFKVDYQWRGKAARPEHPRTVCQELNHVS